MTKKSLVIFIAAIMVVGVIGTNFVPDADALKSKNSASSNTDICGLMLCSEHPGGKTAYQAEWVSMFRSSESVTQQVVKETMDKHHAPVSAHNADEEFPEKLDVFIHKFELDKITADEAIDGIKETYHQYTDAKISNDVIKNVGDKLNLYKKGILNAEDAVEAIHLSAEPQNVNPEYQSALDEVIHKFELDKITADEAIDGIKEVHAGFVGLYITSDLIEGVGTQLAVYDSGRVSMEYTLEEIDEIIELAEHAAKTSMTDDGIPEMKDLPPNTVDIPAGTGVPGCETDNWCYMQSSLTVHVGDTVKWINSDTLPHTVTAGWPDSDSIGVDYPGGNGFDSDFMSAGATFEHTFEVPGEYDYYCQLHPWMIGSIIVE